MQPLDAGLDRRSRREEIKKIRGQPPQTEMWTFNAEPQGGSALN